MSSEDEMMHDDTTDKSTAAVRPFESGRHPVNVAHLVMGVAFLGLTLVWALYEGGLVEPVDLRWFMPVPWLVAGIAGLLAITLTGRRPAPRAAPAERPRDGR